jgi:hypothetical protein
MKITPEQALAELALEPHDQPIRPKKPQKHLPRAVTDPAEIDALIEHTIFESNTKQNHLVRNPN